jgi:hypothetical protein
LGSIFQNKKGGEMNIFMRLLGIGTALLAAMLTKYLLGVSIVGKSWQIDLIGMSVTLDASVSVYTVFAIIYEVGFFFGGVAKEKL